MYQMTAVIVMPLSVCLSVRPPVCPMANPEFRKVVSQGSLYKTTITTTVLYRTGSTTAANAQTDLPWDIQADRRTDRQTDRQTGALRLPLDTISVSPHSYGGVTLPKLYDHNSQSLEHYLKQCFACKQGHDVKNADRS